MKITNRPIEFFNSCPHCGSTFGYCTKDRVEGVEKKRYLFRTGTFIGTGPGRPDVVQKSEHYYCLKCDQPIAKRED